MTPHLSDVVRIAFQDGVLVPALRAYCSPFSVRATNELTDQGPMVIVANHGSHLDAPSILAALPTHIRHRVAVAAAADYFYSNPLRGAVASLGVGAFAFPRHGHAGTARAAALLADGWNVVLFPQGSRGDDESKLPFRAGVGWLLAETGAAVLPIGICGTRALWPRGRSLPRRGPLEVRIGQPWRPGPSLSPRDITAELERRVHALLRDELPL